MFSDEGRDTDITCIYHIGRKRLRRETTPARQRIIVLALTLMWHRQVRSQSWRSKNVFQHRISNLNARTDLYTLSNGLDSSARTHDTSIST